MRSWLYCPGGSPGKIVNASIYGADGVVFDLEDSVREEDKDDARTLLSGALGTLDFGGCRVAVRANGLGSPHWRADLEMAVACGVRTIRVPKVEEAASLGRLCRHLSLLERRVRIPNGSVELQCILETPMGVERAFGIIGATGRIRALCFGAEDYCAAVGIRRGGDPRALDYPRARIAAAAGALGVEAYDTVWGFLDDAEGLEADARRAKSLGFCGKSAIHPNQIPVINRVFSHDEAEVEEAGRIVEADRGSAGASAAGGRMVDRPVVARAMRVVASARQQRSEER